MTFSNRQFPTLCAWKHFKSILQLENHNLFKPLEVEVQGIKAASIIHDCISLCESDLDFCMGLHTKRYMTTNAFLLKQPFLHPFVIFKSFVTLIILSTGFLVHSQIFVDSHKDCGLIVPRLRRAAATPACLLAHILGHCYRVPASST